MNINSSRIRSVDYNESTEILIVEFVSGGKYKYFSVPEEIYNGLVQSASPGNYFDSFIKRTYNFKKA